MPYTYDQRLHRYRNSETGRLVSLRTIEGLSEASSTQAADGQSNLVQQYIDNAVSADKLHDLLKDAIKRQAIREYALGRGGVQQMTAKDWGIVGRFLRDEYKYLDGFIEDIRAGALTEAEMLYRIRLYGAHSSQLYERGKTWFLPKLPAYRGQGSECQANCKCRWEIKAVTDGYDCTWTRSAEESCLTCIQRSSDWAPLQIRNGKIIN